MDLETKTETEIKCVEPELVLEPEPEPEPLYCSFCDWKTHKNAKDKERGLKNHMKKCQFNPENEGKDLQIKKKKVNIEILPPKVSAVVDEIEHIVSCESKEEQKDRLVGDLDILKIKFPNIPFSWNYNTNSSVEYLKRHKTLFLRVLNDEAGTRAMLKLLVLGSTAIEKVADISNVVDLDGYAGDVRDSEEEIYPILKNLVDTGVLSVGHLTPELRLGMIMASLAVARIEKNKTKGNFLNQDDADII